MIVIHMPGLSLLPGFYSAVTYEVETSDEIDKQIITQNVYRQIDIPIQSIIIPYLIYFINSLVYKNHCKVDLIHRFYTLQHGASVDPVAQLLRTLRHLLVLVEV